MANKHLLIDPGMPHWFVLNYQAVLRNHSRKDLIEIREQQSILDLHNSFSVIQQYIEPIENVFVNNKKSTREHVNWHRIKSNKFTYFSHIFFFFFFGLMCNHAMRIQSTAKTMMFTFQTSKSTFSAKNAFQHKVHRYPQTHFDTSFHLTNLRPNLRATHLRHLSAAHPVFSSSIYKDFA